MSTTLFTLLLKWMKNLLSREMEFVTSAYFQLFGSIMRFGMERVLMWIV